MTTPELPITRIDANHAWWTSTMADLLHHRELIYFLVWRDVKVRYQQTALGIAWAVLQPLGTLVVFTLVFGRLAQLPSDGVPYPVFVLAGLLPWQLFSSSLTGAANSIVGSGPLISKVYFPRLIVPIAAVLATLVDFAISFVLLLGLMLHYRFWPSAAVLLLPLFLLLALATALAVGLWSAALHVRYRDIKYVIPFVVQAWLFASPVAYSASLITSPAIRLVYGLNPMAGVVEGFRWALLGSAAPGPLIWAGVAITVAMLAGGIVFFARMEETFADVI